jgi:hypothetical protein
MLRRPEQKLKTLADRVFACVIGLDGPVPKIIERADQRSKAFKPPKMPKAPVRGRSQLFPTGAFNPAAASPAPAAEELDRLIESSTAVNGKLSRDDIRVLPLLRSAAVVKGLRFPRKVRDYFETMMELVGYQPLPAV